MIVDEELLEDGFRVLAAEDQRVIPADFGVRSRPSAPGVSWSHPPSACGGIECVIREPPGAQPAGSAGGASWCSCAARKAR